jgi:hypothetical protein
LAAKTADTRANTAERRGCNRAQQLNRAEDASGAEDASVVADIASSNCHVPVGIVSFYLLHDTV